MRTQHLLAGVDVGTTSVKVALMTPEGAEVAHGRAPTTWTRAAAGVQTDASGIDDATQSALAQALAQVPDVQVIAVGVTSMAESGVLVDRDERVLAPVIAWHDRRDVRQLDDLAEQLGGQEFSRTTGLPLWTQWSLTKHRWMHDRLPQVRAAVRRYAIAEWVVRGLGGDPGSELSLTSRTGWLGLRTGDLWAEAMEWAGASPALLRDLVVAGTPAGEVSADHSLEQLRGAVLTVAGHDHQAAAVGVGATGTHDELDSCGTAEALVRTVPTEVSDAALDELTGAGITVGWHVIRDRWSVLGATEGGLTLQTVMGRLGVDRDGLSVLEDAASQRGDSARSVVEVGTSGDDVHVSGSGDPADVWRAATDTVTDQVKSLSDTISRATGPRGRLVVAGGWSHSATLMTAKRAALGRLERVDVTEAGARGAALLGGIAAGVYPDHDGLPPVRPA